jgi:CspA family cold shock protein
MQGTVKWYDAVKGFGFIQTSEDQDVFVHRSGIKDAHLGLETGQKVEFETKESERGRGNRKKSNNIKSLKILYGK